MYRSALDRLPADASASDRFWLQLSLAEVEFERRDYGAARQWLVQAEATADGSARVKLLNAWGTLHLVQGNPTAAAWKLAEAVDLAEAPHDRAAALHNLAAVEMQAGKLDQAAAHEREAIDLWQPQPAYLLKAWIGMSSIDALRHDWHSAEASILRALAIQETPEALANYAVVLEKLRRGKEARAIRRRFRLDPPQAPRVVHVNALRDGSPGVQSH